MNKMVVITAIVFMDRCLTRYAVAEIRAGLVLDSRYATVVRVRLVLGGRVHHLCRRAESAMECKPVVVQICAGPLFGLRIRLWP